MEIPPLVLNPRTSKKSENHNLPLPFAGQFQSIVADLQQPIQEKVKPITCAFIFCLISFPATDSLRYKQLRCLVEMIWML
jgi:hypothetical protein